MSEGATHHGVPTYSSILDFLFFRGVSGATALKASLDSAQNTVCIPPALVDISDQLPLKIEFIETKEKVDELLGKLEEMAGTGMIEIQETTVAKPARPPKAKKDLAPAHLKIEGKALMMRIT